MTEAKKKFFEDKIINLPDCNFWGLYKGEAQSEKKYYLCSCNSAKNTIYCGYCLTNCHECPDSIELHYLPTVTYTCDCREKDHSKESIKSREPLPNCVFNELLKISPLHQVAIDKINRKKVCNYCFYKECWKVKNNDSENIVDNQELEGEKKEEFGNNVEEGEKETEQLVEGEKSSEPPKKSISSFEVINYNDFKNNEEYSDINKDICDCPTGHNLIKSENFDVDFLKLSLNFNYNQLSEIHHVYKNFYILPFENFDGKKFSTQLQFAINTFNLLDKNKIFSGKYYNPDLLKKIDLKLFFNACFSNTDYSEILSPKLIILNILFENKVKHPYKKNFFTFKHQTLLNINSELREFYLEKHKKIPRLEGMNSIKELNQFLESFLNYIEVYIRNKTSFELGNDNVIIFHRIFKFLIKYNIIEKNTILRYYEITNIWLEKELLEDCQTLSSSVIEITKSILFSTLKIFDKVLLYGKIENGNLKGIEKDHFKKELHLMMKILLSLNRYDLSTKNPLYNTILRMYTNNKIDYDRFNSSDLYKENVLKLDDLNFSQLHTLQELSTLNIKYFSSVKGGCQQYLVDSQKIVEELGDYFLVDKNRKQELKVFATFNNFYHVFDQLFYIYYNIVNYFGKQIEIPVKFKNTIVKLMCNSFEDNIENFILFTNLKFKYLIKIFIDHDEETLDFINIFYKNMIKFTPLLNDLYFYKRFLIYSLEDMALLGNENVIVTSKIITAIIKNHLSLLFVFDKHQITFSISPKVLIDNIHHMIKKGTIFNLSQKDDLLQLLTEEENYNILKDYFTQILELYSFSLINGYIYSMKIPVRHIDIYKETKEIYLNILNERFDPQFELSVLRYCSYFSLSTLKITQKLDLEVRNEYYFKDTLDYNQKTFFKNVIDYTDNDDEIKNSYNEEVDNDYLAIISAAIKNASNSRKNNLEYIAYGLVEPFAVLNRKMMNNLSWKSDEYNQIGHLFIELLKIIIEFTKNRVPDFEFLSFFSSTLKKMENNEIDVTEILDLNKIVLDVIIKFFYLVQKQNNYDLDEKKKLNRIENKSVQKQFLRDTFIKTFTSTMDKLNSVWDVVGNLFIKSKENNFPSVSFKNLGLRSVLRYSDLLPIINHTHGEFQENLANFYSEEPQKIVEIFPFLLLYNFYGNLFITLKNFEKFLQFNHHEVHYPMMIMEESLKIMFAFCYQNKFISNLLFDLVIDQDLVYQSYSRELRGNNIDSQQFNVFDILFNSFMIFHDYISIYSRLTNTFYIRIYTLMINLSIALIREANSKHMDYFSGKDQDYERVSPDFKVAELPENTHVKSFFSLNRLLNEPDLKMNEDIIEMGLLQFKLINEIMNHTLNRKVIVFDILDIFPPSFAIHNLAFYFKKLILKYVNPKEYQGEKEIINKITTAIIFGKYRKNELNDDNILKLCFQLFIYLNLAADNLRNEEAIKILNKKFVKAGYDENLDKAKKFFNTYLYEKEIISMDRTNRQVFEKNYSDQEKDLMCNDFFGHVIKSVEFVFDEESEEKHEIKEEEPIQNEGENKNEDLGHENNENANENPENNAENPVNQENNAENQENPENNENLIDLNGENNQNVDVNVENIQIQDNIGEENIANEIPVNNEENNENQINNVEDNLNFENYENPINNDENIQIQENNVENNQNIDNNQDSEINGENNENMENNQDSNQNLENNGDNIQNIENNENQENNQNLENNGDNIENNENQENNQDGQNNENNNDEYYNQMEDEPQKEKIPLELIKEMESVLEEDQSHVLYLNKNNLSIITENIDFQKSDTAVASKIKKEADKKLKKNIKRIYYVVDPKVFLLNLRELKETILSIDHGDDTKLGNEILDKLPQFIEKITLLKKTTESSEVKNFLIFIEYENVNKINIFVTIILVLLLLLNMDLTNIQDSAIYDVIRIANYLEIIFNGFFVGIFLSTKYKLNVQFDLKFEVTNSIVGFYDLFYICIIKNLLLDEDISFIILNIVLSVLVIIYPYLFGILIIQLFTIIKFIPTIREIFKAFVMKRKQLFNMTFFLAIIILCYSNFAFYFINSDYHLETNTGTILNVCETLPLCALFHFYEGVRHGGGIGEVLSIASFSDKKNYFYRYIGDLLFFVSVVLLLLNMLNGLIITTFAQIREEKERATKSYEEKCMICLINKDNFDEKCLDFGDHFEQHHYRCYVFFLLSMKFTDYFERSVEQHKVNKMADEGKIDFLPLNRSLYINNGEIVDK